MMERIEPFLGHKVPTILYDYPTCLGALARRKPTDEKVCERFEAYVCGVELCNAFSELTDDDAFWRGCGTPGHPCCVNFDVLQRSDRRYCVCTGMLYDPAEHEGEPLPLQLPDEVVQKIKKMAELESKTN